MRERVFRVYCARNVWYKVVGRRYGEFGSGNAEFGNKKLELKSQGINQVQESFSGSDAIAASSTFQYLSSVIHSQSAVLITQS